LIKPEPAGRPGLEERTALRYDLLHAEKLYIPQLLRVLLRELVYKKEDAAYHSESSIQSSATTLSM